MRTVIRMSLIETESKSIENEKRLEVVRKEGNDFIVKVPGREIYVVSIAPFVLIGSLVT